MKSTKFKVLLLATSLFAFSATFAQDTTNKPKPDTSKTPKHDSTSMRTTTGGGSMATNVSAINLSLTKTKDKVAAKKEETTS